MKPLTNGRIIPQGCALLSEDIPLGGDLRSTHIAKSGIVRGNT